MFARQLFSCLVAVSLVCPGVSAAPAANPAVVGIATASHAATLQQADLRAGATVFNGDLLAVGPEGAALVSLSLDSALRFGADTSAKLLRLAAAKDVAVELHRGSLMYRAASDASIEVRLADAVIRRAGNVPVTATVAFLSPTRAVVGVEAGSLTVSTARDGRSVTLRESESVELTLADPAPQPQAGTSKSLSGPKVALIGAVVIIAITVVGLSIRNNGLTRQQQVDLVSPFRLP